MVTFSVNLPRKKTSKFDHQRILVLVIFSVASAHPQDVKKGSVDPNQTVDYNNMIETTIFLYQFLVIPGDIPRDC